MRIIAAIYFIVGIVGCVVFSMLLLAQYNVVVNAYSIANKDWTAKSVGWMMLVISVFFIVIAVVFYPSDPKGTGNNPLTEEDGIDDDSEN